MTTGGRSAINTSPCWTWEPGGMVKDGEGRGRTIGRGNTSRHLRRHLSLNERRSSRIITQKFLQYLPRVFMRYYVLLVYYIATYRGSMWYVYRHTPVRVYVGMNPSHDHWNVSHVTSSSSWLPCWYDLEHTDQVHCKWCLANRTNLFSPVTTVHSS